MSFGLIFWILMLLWLIFGVWDWRSGWSYWYGHGIFLFVLFLLLGWKTFGAPVHP
jgi:hypothetical protein